MKRSFAPQHRVGSKSQATKNRKFFARNARTLCNPRDGVMLTRTLFALLTQAYIKAANELDVLYVPIGELHAYFPLKDQYPTEAFQRLVIQARLRYPNKVQIDQKRGQKGDLVRIKVADTTINHSLVQY